MRITEVPDELRDTFAEDDPTPRFMKIVVGIMVAFLVVFGLLAYVMVFVLS